MSEPLPASLDPDDWTALRAQGHAMLDDMFAHLEGLRGRPVWQPIPDAVRASFGDPLPAGPTDLDVLHRRFMHDVLPYSVGNAHPRFMGWVQGGGTAVGMLAEMLAAGLNANVGGRDQIPLEVERQVVRWMRDLFGFPDSAGGLFLTGSSMANLLGVLIARTQALGEGSRQRGVAASGGAGLVAYTSAAAHGCVAQAMAISGLGTEALRRVPVDARHRIDLQALERLMADDQARGLRPFLVVGTAGTVDVGAVDDLAALAAAARRHGAWFHVDGAYGALGMLSPELAPLLAGIEQADSIALDFHKWGQVPYDAGFILVRRQSDQLAAFASPAAYLSRHERGLAAGSPWPCDLGPDLSRGFRALKTWFTLLSTGRERLGGAIAHTCALARRLRDRLQACPEFELLAPVTLNIVCFRHRAEDADRFNTELVADLQESGVAVPSTTTVDGQVAIRVAIVNHRTTAADIDLLVDALQALGQRRLASAGGAAAAPEAASGAGQGAGLLGLARIMTLAFQGQDLRPLAQTLIGRAQRDAEDADALLDLSNLLLLQNQREVGLATLELALQTRRLYTLPAPPGADLRVLALMAGGDLMANTPLPFLTDPAGAALSLLYLRPGEPLPAALPEHDVLFVALSESDDNTGLLDQLTPLLADWPKPVCNRPQAIRETSRARAFGHLQGVPGLHFPPSLRVSRALLESAAQAGLLPGGLAYPVIVRPVDSHAGHDLERLADASALAAYLQATAAAEFYLSPFIDYRSADGQFRKYRVCLVDGRPYASHMGVSSHWMIHYLNAGMTESAAKRAEEEAFMRGFEQPGGFADRHGPALREMARRCGLDYLVIDCAETRAGELLVFEIDPGAVVHSMDPDDLFPYKRPHMDKVYAAFRRLLLRLAGRGGA